MSYQMVGAQPLWDLHLHALWRLTRLTRLDMVCWKIAHLLIYIYIDIFNPLTDSFPIQQINTIICQRSRKDLGHPAPRAMPMAKTCADAVVNVGSSRLAPCGAVGRVLIDGRILDICSIVSVYRRFSPKLVDKTPLCLMLSNSINYPISRKNQPGIVLKSTCSTLCPGVSTIFQVFFHHFSWFHPHF